LKRFIDFKNLKVTDELNAAQKSATGLGEEVKLCSLIIDAKDTSIKVYREYPEYSFSTLVSDIGGSGLVQNILALLNVTIWSTWAHFDELNKSWFGIGHELDMHS